MFDDTTITGTMSWYRGIDEIVMNRCFLRWPSSDEVCDN